MLVLARSLTRDLKIFTSTLTAIALLLTLYRVVYRYAIHRLWREDVCAFVALIGSVICVTTSWLHFELAGQSAVTSFWIYIFTCPAVIWSTRLSILLSILRLTSPSRNFRRVMISTACLFVLMWFSLTMALVGRCASGHLFYTDQRDKKGTHSVAIFELIADILSDCILISFPIHSLRFVRLPYTQRRLIIAAFSSTVFIIVASLFRAACQIIFNIPPLIAVAVDIQVACSLFVCNSLFITTLFYRMLRRNGAATETDANFPNSQSPSTPKDTLQLTTIDLDAFDNITIDSFSTDNRTPACPSDDPEKFSENSATTRPEQ